MSQPGRGDKSDPMRVVPITLEGARVRLEPLEERHRAEFVAAACSDPGIFRWFTHQWDTPELAQGFFDHLRASVGRGECVAFATIDRATGRLAGGTCFMALAPEHRRLEIGSTWIVPEFQRTHVNTEAKLLMFRHCFEMLGCVRVELKTDVLNERSRNAMLRIGCTQEGVLRSHMVCQGGRLRDTIYFSVLAPEWPRVREHLERLILR